MFRTAARIAPRASRTITAAPSSQRFLTTAPPHKTKRSWKNAALRWGVAGAGVWWYATSPLFAEEPDVTIASVDSSLHAYPNTSKMPTLEDIAAEKRRRSEELALAQRQAEAKAQADAQSAVKEGAEQSEEQGEQAEGGMEGLQDEADQQGAFNPETGEINWDCPCLGGMAHGVCGEEFRTAFSCFVYSTEEPKGMDCIEKFQGMQDCFRAHPDVYGAELADDEDEVEAELNAREAAKENESAEKPASSPHTDDTGADAKDIEKKMPGNAEKKGEGEGAHRDGTAAAPKEGVKSGDEGGDLIPRAMHDASSKN